MLKEQKLGYSRRWLAKPFPAQKAKSCPHMTWEYLLLCDIICQMSIGLQYLSGVIIIKDDFKFYIPLSQPFFFQVCHSGFSAQKTPIFFSCFLRQTKPVTFFFFCTILCFLALVFPIKNQPCPKLFLYNPVLRIIHIFFLFCILFNFYSSHFASGLWEDYNIKI